MSGYYVLSPAACFPPSRSVLAAVSLWSMATNSVIYTPAPFGITWSWSFVLLCFVTLALAEVQDADDTNPGMFYTGIWTPDGDPNAFGSHDTWTNQSGASVSFDFIGTQVSVFVTRRPIGTYLTNASFSIDGGPPTFWTTSDPVPAISYKNLVYTSRSLSRAQHRITVTNLGKFFWLDYMEYTVAGASASVISTPTQDPMGTDSGLSSVVTRPTGAVSPAVAAASTSSRTAMIVGIVVGVLGGVALLASVLWWLRMRSQARQREIESLAPTPFAGHGQSQRSASNGAKTLSPHLGFARTSEKDVERGAHEVVPHLLACDDISIAGVAPSSATVGHSEIILEAIPDDGGQLSTRTGPPRIPSVPETVYPSSSTRTAPISRSAWLARALSLSSARYRDPALASTATTSKLSTHDAASSPGGAGSATSASSSHRPLYFRVLRRSRDGGVRIAGGRPGDQGTHTWTPAAYDDVLEVLSESSTMPPSYVHYSGSAPEA